MPKPKRVKVGAYLIKLRYVKDLRRLSDNQPAWGHAHLDQEVMELESHQPPQRMAETFLHEMIHLVDDERGIALSEQQTGQLAAGLYAFVVDNPRLFGRRFMRLWGR